MCSLTRRRMLQPGAHTLARTHINIDRRRSAPHRNGQTLILEVHHTGPSAPDISICIRDLIIGPNSTYWSTMRVYVKQWIMLDNRLRYNSVVIQLARINIFKKKTSVRVCEQTRQALYFSGSVVRRDFENIINIL